MNGISMAFLPSGIRLLVGWGCVSDGEVEILRQPARAFDERRVDGPCQLPPLGMAFRADAEAGGQLRDVGFAQAPFQPPLELVDQ